MKKIFTGLWLMVGTIISGYTQTPNEVFHYVTASQRSISIGDFLFDNMGNLYSTGYGSILIDQVPCPDTLTDTYLFKADPAGNPIWAKKTDMPNSIGYMTVDDDDNLYALTYNGETGIIKFDPNGNLLWSKQLVGFNSIFDARRKIKLNNDLGILYLVDGGDSEICMLKMDLDGNVIWTKDLVAPPMKVLMIPPVKDYVILSNGGLIIIGDMYYDPYFIGVKPNGDVNWVKCFDFFMEKRFAPVEIEQVNPNRFLIIGSRMIEYSGNYVQEGAYCFIDSLGVITSSGLISNTSCLYDMSKAGNNFIINAYREVSQDNQVFIEMDENGNIIRSYSGGETYYEGELAPRYFNEVYVKANLDDSLYIKYEHPDSSLCFAFTNYPLDISYHNLAEAQYDYTLGVQAGHSIIPSVFNYQPGLVYRETLCNNVMLSVDDEMADPDFIVYPNPTKDLLMLKFNGTIKRIKITDQLGKIVFMQNDFDPSIEQIDLSSLSSGIYQLSIETLNQNFARKIIKL